MAHTPLMPRKNLWFTDKSLTDLASLQKKWGTSEGETVRRALELASKKQSQN